MAKKIDWMYDRKACTTCKKSRGHLEAVGCAVTEKVDATKVRYGADDALALLDGIDKLVAMKGTKVVEFDLKKARPEDETLLAHLIGPTGNLRAPTAKLGKVMLVGFNEETYRQYVG